MVVTSALAGFDSVMTTRLFKDHALRSGVLGSITTIPAGHRLEVVVHVGSDGINKAYNAWGALLLAAAGDKKARAVDADAGIMLSHLGYSTTAAYFYSPEGAKGTWPNLIPGKTFEETIVDVYEYAKRVGLPYRSVLLDSWWYGNFDIIFWGGFFLDHFPRSFKLYNTSHTPRAAIYLVPMRIVC